MRPYKKAYSFPITFQHYLLKDFYFADVFRVNSVKSFLKQNCHFSHFSIKFEIHIHDLTDTRGLCVGVSLLRITCFRRKYRTSLWQNWKRKRALCSRADKNLRVGILKEKGFLISLFGNRKQKIKITPTISGHHFLENFQTYGLWGYFHRNSVFLYWCRFS